MLGSNTGAKLVFSQPNAMRTEVGFYPGEASDPDTNGMDPVEFLQARIKHGP